VPSNLYHVGDDAGRGAPGCGDLQLVATAERSRSASIGVGPRCGGPLRGNRRRGRTLADVRCREKSASPNGQDCIHVSPKRASRRTTRCQVARAGGLSRRRQESPQQSPSERAAVSPAAQSAEFQTRRAYGSTRAPPCFMQSLRRFWVPMTNRPNTAAGSLAKASVRGRSRYLCWPACGGHLKNRRQLGVRAARGLGDVLDAVLAP